ncbi:adenine-specific methyltransferase EcoRI family protein [Sulfitobacter sp. HGT1]|uniref:adenine-specific methyltransferase EcoRI family protein n=1 Tax=Sulfitobacter sp. HGT1 TaxID=2735435 RepID=UPI0015937602|nr:adenine-specific methyltransferase EcoRI family protein [Sulfitobacter sp. HGT1]
MANENLGLQQARRNKRDEFYTQLPDIEREMRHYRKFFRGKTVYCNCDDPFISAFSEYFTKNFEFLGIKKLITTCYRSQEINLFSRNDSEQAIKLEYEGGATNSLPSSSDMGVSVLNGDGDFRSDECIEIMKEADVVVTNPPFSLFGEFVNLLNAHDKKFIIIGHQNALTYTAVFPLLRANRIWLGYGFKRNMAHFIAPHYEDTASDADHKAGMIRVSGVVWYTNVDHNKRHEEMILVRRYHGNEAAYPRYDNYDAVEVSKTQDIPMDYNGAMGVPITFMTKYNPEQFEIVGATESEGTGASAGLWDKSSRVPQAMVNGAKVYKRIFIRNLNPIESDI